MQIQSKRKHGFYHRSSSTRSIESLGSLSVRPQQRSAMARKGVRTFLYLLGLLSLVLVLFMAQRLESRYGGGLILMDQDAFEKRRTSVKSEETKQDRYGRPKKTSGNADAHRAAMEKDALLEEEKKQKEEKQRQEEDERREEEEVKQRQEEEKKRKEEEEKRRHDEAIANSKKQRSKDDPRLVDPRLADTSKEKVIQMETKVEVVASAPAGVNGESSVEIASAAGANLLIVVISNRRDGIIPTLASIITTASRPVDVVVIGEHSINEQVRAHFGSRINEFTSMSVQDITDDLVAQGLQPIWTWPEWHTSMDPSWKNENTLHVGPWDNLQTHAHELNHLRFYLPHVSIFKTKGYFFFIDDDLLIKKDLGVVAEKTMGALDASRGLVCPCNIWMWNAECFHFEFQSKKDKILQMPSLYGDREVCKTESEAHCVPENYWDFVESVLPEGGKDQFAWNFGFSLFALKNWRDLKLTEKYEGVMKESYRLHVFPETSLTFGLGVPYIAFAGAVECWNEDNLQVRDGFGFIEWDRFSDTFGSDFFDAVDVVHYTGPDKPWVNESRIETRAIGPWLDMMEHEKMPIPKQLPEEPIDNLFTLLAGDRTGSHWFMTALDSHPKICASGEADKPETGFPAEILLPDGLGWYPYCSIKRGCSHEFIQSSMKELMSNTTAEGLPLRCDASYDKSNDPLVVHLERLCNFVRKLEGKFDESHISKIYVDAFAKEDRSLLGCGCVRGVKAKGLKVLTEWIFPKDEDHPPAVNLNETRVHGSKIIRLRRRNLWARYKSKFMAENTGIYHAATPGEKKSQITAMKDVKIEVEHMEWHMKNMERLDRLANEWASEHGSEVLQIDYEDCRADTEDCFKRIYSFIGVDESVVTGKQADIYKSAFAEFAESDSTLEFVENKGEIKELLGVNGWDHYVSGTEYIPIQLLTYEEKDLHVDTRKHMGINVTWYGEDKEAEGHGSRYAAALPILKSMDPDSLVVLNSDRDGRVSYPVGDHGTTFRFLYRFRKTFEEMTAGSSGGIVVSTDSDCCASALTHASPGDYFDEQGGRKARACISGEPGCEWAGNDKAQPWESFMKELASKRSESTSRHLYLDTSLIAGRAGDLVKLVEALDIQKDEDDRAVLTDYMYRNPDSILLDYKQQLLGESRKTVNRPSCFGFKNDAASEIRRLDAVHPEEQPLFMYSPKSLGCGGDEKFVAPRYPVWEGEGIQLQPIIDHIDRVADKDASVVLPPYYPRKPDYHQGPEVPYIIDEKGIWTSKLIRDFTNNATMFWRMAPTERLTKKAHNVLTDKEFNQGRWPALEKAIEGGGFPYFMWYGDFKTCNYHNYNEDSIPLFTTCAMAGCNHAFPVPNYMTIIDTQKNEQDWIGVFEEFQRDYPWDKKKRQVVWRGALSEAEWRDALTSVRWRLAKKVHEMKSDLYDVGLTGIPDWLTEYITFDLSEIGGFVEGIKPMAVFQNYIAILDMDGNSWSSRFGSLLCYNSVVIKIEPKYFDYFYADLKPWTHFIPVKNDLSDLDEKVRWALDEKNEGAVKSIIQSANQYCSKRLVRPELATDMLDIFESYVRQLDLSDPDWQSQWNKKKEQMFASPQLQMVNLESELALINLDDGEKMPTV